MKKILVISLGGSIVVPDKINVSFLKNFRKTILKHSKKYKFIIVVGGGQLARKYQKALRKIAGPDQEALDWVGISATHHNAFLLKTIFYPHSHSTIVQNPTKKIYFKKILFAGGWKPGCSTDYDAVMLAKTYKAQTIINMTSISYLYDKNPHQYKKAQIIKKTDWKTLRKIVGPKWSPGLHAPFDPEAVKLGQKLNLQLIFLGSDLNNFDNFLSSKKFQGSIVRD